MAGQQCIRLVVHGLVQGVFFRQQTRKTARRLGVTGLVRNEPDGTVYIEACGEPGTLEAFVQWCHDGPDGARVTRVDKEEIADTTYDGFEIRYR